MLNLTSLALLYLCVVAIADTWVAVQLHVYLAPGSYSSGRLPDAVTLLQLIVSLKKLVELDLRQPPEKFWSEQCHAVLAKARHAASAGLGCNPALTLYT